MREYKTIKALRNGETIDFEGVPLKMTEGELGSGDTYIAERNTGPQLLTVRHVATASCDCGECDAKPYPYLVAPVEMAYAYDYNECVKVTFVEEETV